MHRCFVALAVSVSLFAVPKVAGASEVTLAACILDGGSTGDQLDRAFYMRDFPGTNLGKVTLYILPGTDGASYLITVTAHDETFDGPVIGAVTTEINHVPSVAQFDFRGAPVHAHHTVAFVVGLPVTDGGVAFMQNGNDQGCAAIEETNGSSPPLDSDRGGMGAIITTYGPEISSVTPGIGSPAGGSGVTVAASFVGSTTTLTFGGAPASSISLPDGGVGEAGTFLAVTPPHAEGQVDVDLSVSYVNDGGVDASATASIHNGYFYGSDVIDSGGGGNDDGGASTSRADGGNADAGSSDDSGCGCDLPGSAAAPGSFGAAVLAIGALFAARRRRR